MNKIDVQHAHTSEPFLKPRPWQCLGHVVSGMITRLHDFEMNDNHLPRPSSEMVNNVCVLGQLALFSVLTTSRDVLK
jgi:hypothetical protein